MNYKIRVCFLSHLVCELFTTANTYLYVSKHILITTLACQLNICVSVYGFQTVIKYIGLAQYLTGILVKPLK